MSTSAAVSRPISVRDGAFSRRLMLGCEQRSRPLPGARPTASLTSGPECRSSQPSASSPGDRLRRPGGRLRRRRSRTCGTAASPSVEIDPPVKSAVTFLRRTAGKSNGRRLYRQLSAPSTGWRWPVLSRPSEPQDATASTVPAKCSTFWSPPAPLAALARRAMDPELVALPFGSTNRSGASRNGEFSPVNVEPAAVLVAIIMS